MTSDSKATHETGPAAPAPGRWRILRVAVARPLQGALDYLPPAGKAPAAPVGCRVEVPLGKGKAVGVVVEIDAVSPVPANKLRPARQWLDTEPLLPTDLLETLAWASRYYRYPVGSALATAMPSGLRKGQKARRAARWWFLTAEGSEPGAVPRRAPRQAELQQRLLRLGGAAPVAELLAVEPAWQQAARAMEKAGLLRTEYRPPDDGAAPRRTAPLALEEAQRRAVDAIRGALGHYRPILLNGVTGSGKTEVYAAAAEEAVATGGQMLILVPEIALAPQILARLREHLGVKAAVVHSDLPESERVEAWLAARDGDASVIIGTRSAVFTPLRNPALIVVDEEHDSAYSQQDGLRYSARDLAVLRAQRLGVPVVLGSATPSLESIHNARRGRYLHLRLPARAGGARPPSIGILDIRSRALDGGISEPLRAATARHLAAGGQVLYFLNRRGYAPVLTCHACGWVAECHRCDARLTLHRGQGRMRCHHCGHAARIPDRCPECRGDDLRPLGPGTERVEEALTRLFPDAPLVRIDRDTTRRRGALEAKLEAAHSGAARVLLGTQMLAKGHHLPDVTLVAVVDADQGLFGADFRATERLAQLVIQVAGRAGRGERPGEVLIQTRHPEHPLLHTLLEHGYDAFATQHLEERRGAGLPPFGALALLRAESVDAQAPYRFLEAAAAQGADAAGGRVELLGPVPAPMERREGRHRAQLLIRAEARPALQGFLEAWHPGLSDLPGVRRVRWSLDVDPSELL